MRRRVMGGLIGWIIGALPLVGINVATALGYYFDNPLLASALALLAGLLLGGSLAALVGGRSPSGSERDMSSAGVSGGIAAVLYAITIMSLVLAAPSLGLIPPLSSDQILRIAIAVLFCAALLLGVSLLTGLLLGAHRGPDTDPAPVPPAPQRYQRSPSGAYSPGRTQRNPESPAQLDNGTIYTTPKDPAELDENSGVRRYQPSYTVRPSGPNRHNGPSGPNRSSGPHQSRRDPYNR